MPGRPSAPAATPAASAPNADTPLNASPGSSSPGAPKFAYGLSVPMSPSGALPTPLSAESIVTGRIVVVSSPAVVPPTDNMICGVKARCGRTGSVGSHPIRGLTTE